MQPISIHQYQRQPISRSLAVRFCSPQDLDALLALQKIIEEHLPDSAIFVSTTPEEWSEHLQTPHVIGLWDSETLAAYGLFLLCGLSEENYAWHLGFPQERIPLWANMDTIVVHPDYRGNGLETALLYRMEALCPPEIQGFCCTISPNNPHSLESARRAGYVPMQRASMYGGYDRWILKKERT